MQTSASAVASTPNVTPMIDVMLVLLIIFMVVAPALISGIVAEPPRALNLRSHPDESGDHTLAIDVTGAFFLDRHPISVANLGAALASLYPATSSNRVLYVHADKNIAYSRVLDAIEVARKQGVAVLGLISEHKSTH